MRAAYRTQVEEGAGAETLTLSTPLRPGLASRPMGSLAYAAKSNDDELASTMLQRSTEVGVCVLLTVALTTSTS